MENTRYLIVEVLTKTKDYLVIRVGEKFPKGHPGGPDRGWRTYPFLVRNSDMDAWCLLDEFHAYANDGPITPNDIECDTNHVGHPMMQYLDEEISVSLHDPNADYATGRNCASFVGAYEKCMLEIKWGNDHMEINLI